MNRHHRYKEVGTLSDVLQYFKLHPQIFQSQQPASKSHMERVMAVLNHDNMQHLQKEFQLYSKGLELPTFIYLMKKLYIPDNQFSKYFFVSDLIKFFQNIDINGDGHLEWTEFTQYIIENIRVVEKPKYKNVAYEENQIISSAYSRISNQYKIKKVWDLGTSNVIRKIIFSPYSNSLHFTYEKSKEASAGLYYILESNSNIIKIYNGYNFAITDSVELEPSINKSYIIDFSLDKINNIVGIIFEEEVYFINLKIKAATKHANKCSELVNLPDNSANGFSFLNFNKIQFLSFHNLWCITSKTGEVLLLNVSYSSRVQPHINSCKLMNYHQETITQIIEMELPSKFIVTASLDGTIKMYCQEISDVMKVELIPEHMDSIVDAKKKKGILGVDGSCQFGNYVISYGFNNEVYIYSLDMSIIRGYISRYIEHSGNIISANFLKGYPYVISFDDKLNLRIWDFRKLQTMQLLNCQKIFINPSALQLTLISQKSEFLISEKKLTQFKAPLLQEKSREINQFHDIFQIKYCIFTNCIFVFTSIDVRVYSYYTGTLKKLFTKLYESNYETNITAAEFGYKNKRFFVGDAAGLVRQFCAETGDLLQQIQPHSSSQDSSAQYENKEIVSIIFLKDHSLLICCSLDGRIMIYERNQDSEYEIVRDFRECHDELVCAGASNRYCLLATASEDGSINIWNLDKYTLEGMCVMSKRIIGISFSPIHPIMIVCTEDGYLNLVYVRPYDNIKARNKCFARIRMLDSFDNSSLTSFSFQLILRNYLPEDCPLLGQSTLEEEQFLQHGTSQYGGTNNLINGSLRSSSFAQSRTQHNLIACVGTSSSQIKLINLNPILILHKIEQNHQIYSIKNCQRTQIQHMKGVLINQRNRILLNGYTNQGKDVQTYEYKQFCCVQIDTVNNNRNSETTHGHKHNSIQQKVKNIYLSKECGSIMMKGCEKKMKLFSLVPQEKNQQGKNTKQSAYRYKCTGAINFSTFKKHYWMLPEINLYKKLQAIDTTLYSIKLIESKKFTAKEEQKIKVCLLLNQVVPNIKDKEKYYEWMKKKTLRKLSLDTESKQLFVQKLKPKQDKKISYEDHKDYMTQVEFNQVYQKLITSITRSLGQEYMDHAQSNMHLKNKNTTKNDYTATTREQCVYTAGGQKNKTHQKKKNNLTQKQKSIDGQNGSSQIKTSHGSRGQSTTNLQFSARFQTPKYHHFNSTKSYKNTNHGQNLNKQIFKSTLQSFLEPLKGYNKSNRDDKKGKSVKKKNLLFISLSNAQKCIETRNNFSKKIL